MGTKKKMLMAGSLILIWAAVAVLQGDLLEAPIRVPLTNITGPATGGRQLDGRGVGVRVNLSLLKATVMQRDATYQIPRNIFTMTAVEEPLSADSTVAIANQAEAPSPDTLTEGEGGVESGQVRYLGFMSIGRGPQNRKPVAVLRKDDDVLVLKAGDRIDDRLVLKKITPESVTVRDPRTQVEQTVVLSDEVESQE
ncbi:MAG TPA: hypothetical protein PKD12_06100 [Nitrospira sp.]|nr:hypothetical protein [Nitrospira sp.]